MTIRSFDKLDRQLIALLQSNARDTATTLAKKLGVARTTVHERIARLERNGTIQGYTVVLNRNPFGEYTKAMVLLKVPRHKQMSLVDLLRRMPEVKICQALAGEYDMVCLVEASHMNALDELLVEVSSLPGVEKTNSSVVISTKIDRRVGAIAATPPSYAQDISKGEAG